MRAGHAELGRLAVHLRYEIVDRARNMLGDGFAGVVAGDQHQP
jgi:hypothetical protein